MKEWIISVCAVVIITTIITLIAPNGKLGKFIKSIFSLIVTLVILQPIQTFDFSSFDFDFVTAGSEVILQENYLDYVSESSIIKKQTNCEELLAYHGIKNSEVIIDYTVSESHKVKYEKVSINLENAVIISGKEHIDIIDEIKKIVSEYLTVNKDDLVIYGK